MQIQSGAGETGFLETPGPVIDIAVTLLVPLEACLSIVVLVQPAADIQAGVWGTHQVPQGSGPSLSFCPPLRGVAPLTLVQGTLFLKKNPPHGFSESCSE
jgi:hypothetical protein